MSENKNLTNPYKKHEEVKRWKKLNNFKVEKKKDKKLQILTEKNN